MTGVVLGVAAILAAVAAAGVVSPFRRGHPAGLEADPDPLEEERRRLMRSLRDLEDERATGALTDDAYAALRGELEARTVTVLRTLERRNGRGTLAEGLREIAAATGGAGRGVGSRGGRRRSLLAAMVVVAVAAGAMIPLLAGSLRDRSPGQAVTGDVPGRVDAVTFFEQRVRRHPDDLAARLDLGQRYLERGDAEAAVQQYLEALRIDPRSAEAHAQLGFVLHLAGRPDEALQAVDRGLEIDRAYPLALYYRGVILLNGLDRPRQAAEAFRGYLREAPFGSLRDDAERLLERAATR